MPAVQFAVNHNIDPDEVVIRLKRFIATLRERNEPKFLVQSEQWEDRKLKCSFSSYGFGMESEIQVEPTELKFHVQIPFAAIIFKGQIEERLRYEMQKLLS